MKIIGIICEYNPLHVGHEKQIRHLKVKLPGCAVVCLMSGNYVQRGYPAVFDKSLRAKAAILSGADLVLELPIQYALSSAEGFAAGGVEILSKFCDAICFGCESGDETSLMAVAKVLLAADFSQKLRLELDKGLSFPAARQAALGNQGALLRNPNDILAVEYCKAILAQGSSMQILPIRREGSYHAEEADPENPSATAVRQRIMAGEDWRALTPAAQVYEKEPVHTLNHGEKAILYRLRTMTEVEFEALPYGNEGLWRKLMQACRSEATLEGIIAATKSKRYTRSRIDRMVMCAFLGISREMLQTPAAYARVLAFNDTGREVLKVARQQLWLPNAGQPLEHPQYAWEQRCDDLYTLFSDVPEEPGAAHRRRVFCLK